MRRLLRFRISSLIWAILVTSLLVAWYRDHQNLAAQLPQNQWQGRGWSVLQAVGAPDTPGAGDISTAWASATPDGQREWLVVEFPKAVLPTQIEIHETFNPGAIDRITRIDRFGREVTLWEGTDPTPPSQPRGVSKFIPARKLKIRWMKIYVDSLAVAGWNEIDAVGLTDAKGVTHWASNAWASSAFGGNQPIPKPWRRWIPW